jgi:hypothetical protein
MSNADVLQEQAKKMVIKCPKNYWIVDDQAGKTVYYKNQKSPHDTIPTDYTTDHVLTAHRTSPGYTYHIALDKHDPANSNDKRLHYSPV